MNETYLNKVLIYLRQELPVDYRDAVNLIQERFVITVPENANFQQCYEMLHECITMNIHRVRVREFDLDFSVRSENQERDFKIVK